MSVDDSPGRNGLMRVLLAYAEAAEREPLLERLGEERYAVISYPLAAFEPEGVGALDPDIVLLVPPAKPRELVATCQAVRAAASCPIIVYSACGRDVVVAQALTLGIDEYLTAPVGSRELSARLESLVRRSRRAERNGSVAGDLSLSAADLSAERAGRKIALSPIEFKLLSCLVGAAGRVVTHDALMLRVWGPEYVSSRHYLHLYIRYLREKIEDDPKSPELILSEWGVGYRFQPATAEATPQSMPLRERP